MLSIRFARRGRRNQAHFRIVVVEKRKDPWGDFLEDLGFYNPRTKDCNLKKERILYWISQGAQPTGSVHNLLVNKGVIKGPKVKVTKVHKSKQEQEQKQEQKQESEQKQEQEQEQQEPIQDIKEESEQKQEDNQTEK
ncbi:MAG: 30S ribosomal protein S16 [Candidatus Heimdallarchaeota archaeon]